MPPEKTDAQFRAESDVRTLTEAAAIKVDTPRMSKARRAAKGMAREEEVKARATRRIAAATPRQKRQAARSKKKGR